MTDLTITDRAKGSLLGLAIGDALGTTLEFKPKDSYTHITDMVGGGPFRLKTGEFTDDTSMMLCLAESLIEAGGIDQNDQMARYLKWRYQGYNSCTATCFDIGNTVSAALSRFERTGNPQAGDTSEYSAGNGSLMRLAPVPLKYRNATNEELFQAAHDSSVTTHAESRCIQACQLFSYYIARIYQSSTQLTKQQVVAIDEPLKTASLNWHPEMQTLVMGEYISKPRDEIFGTGYVVASAEAALWCFMHSDNFEQGALMAANLGDDADTTAAIYGQLAGAFYGEQGIPAHWLDKLAWRERISRLALSLAK